MAKKNPVQDKGKYDPPKSLDETLFYGMVLDDDQKVFRDAIWDDKFRFVTVDAVAGSGKTTIAVATSTLLYEYGIVDGCMYCRTPSSEGKIGFLKGDQADKERPYMQPLYNSLSKIGKDPYATITSHYDIADKYQTSFWTAVTNVYMLGDDIKKKAVVIDEAQCMTIDELKTLITRCHDDCKVIVIGSSLQIQGINKNESGFSRCIEHFSDKPWAINCKLTINNRGEMSAWADKM